MSALVALAAELFVETFDDGLDRWLPITSDIWEIRQEDGNSFAALKQPGKLRDGVRRPGEYMLVKDRRWRNVTITARVQSLRPSSVKGRDVCIVFGHQDDTHFYYAHISNDSNNSTHNVIMKVDGDSRRSIMVEKRPEPRLSDGWHTVRVRHLADGTIQVYVDDLETPLMTAHDETWAGGGVGFGAFDDPAAFDDIEITGEADEG